MFNLLQCYFKFRQTVIHLCINLCDVTNVAYILVRYVTYAYLVMRLVPKFTGLLGQLTVPTLQILEWKFGNGAGAQIPVDIMAHSFCVRLE